MNASIRKHQDNIRKQLSEIDKKLSDNSLCFSERQDLEDERERLTIEILPIDKKWFTQFVWSDAHCFEIVEQRTPDLYMVRRMKATITPEADKKLKDSFIPGGFCGHFDNSLQEWSFESDDNNPVIAIRRHKNGKFYAANTRTCPFVMLDHQFEHYDYNF